MTSAPSPTSAPYTVVGRYAIFDEIASGGMATVHLGRLLGAAGFSRTVAIKRLHPQFARDQEFATMFIDEAHLASRINHPNVVQTIDVAQEGKDILLVMEYVHGVAFSQLLGTSRRAAWRVPAKIIAGVMVGVLEGLHAAHEAKNEIGKPLDVVHRDVSPQNVLIGVDGTARVIDFGVAKAMGKMHATRDGQVKGKLCYMAPEQVKGGDVTRLSDLFAAAIVLWEALMAERLFDGRNPAELIMQVMSAPIRRPRDKFPDLPEALDEVVMKGLSRDPAGRYPTAREMAVALESAVGGVAPAREIAEWVESMAGPALAQRTKMLESIERTLATGTPISSDRRKSPASDPETGFEASDPSDPRIGLESGPKANPAPIPIAGALRAEDRPLDHLGFEATLPNKVRTVPPPRQETSRPGPAEDGSAPRPIRSIAASGKTNTPVPPALADNPITQPSPLDAPVLRPREGGPRRIPVRNHDIGAEDRSSMLERLAWPIRLVVGGVVLSLVDFGVRTAGIALPFRPLWAAEVFVVVGVIWAFVRIALPSREE